MSDVSTLELLHALLTPYAGEVSQAGEAFKVVNAACRRGSNREDGISHYLTGGDDAREWFTAQWRAWPKRVDERYTTNLAFHHGGICAYRAEHGSEPEISGQLRGAIKYLESPDRQSLTKGENA